MAAEEKVVVSVDCLMDCLAGCDCSDADCVYDCILQCSEEAGAA